LTNCAAAKKKAGPTYGRESRHELSTRYLRPLDDAEYDELDEFLLSLESDKAIFCLSQLDGFLTAIVSGPEGFLLFAVVNAAQMEQSIHRATWPFIG
jgi:hypothetical protein